MKQVAVDSALTAVSKPRGGERPRVLCLLMSRVYGTPAMGESYELHNILPAFSRLPFESRQFDYAQQILDHGYWGARANLRRVVEEWKPHALFVVIYQEQIDRDLMRWISQDTSTTTVVWFSDDHWRFESHSRFWAGAFNWVVTTDAAAVPKFRSLGQPNVILSQWAANECVYRPVPGDCAYDVSFVGARYGRRKHVVDFLVRHGIAVEAWGQGWPNGRATQEEMVRVFSSSRVNLNLAASSVSPGAVFRPPANQIKGRVFEVPACGGLLLTDRAPELEKYYEIGKEVVVFDGKRDLLRTVRRLLEDEPQRAAIARAGYERTVHDHTWVNRLVAIFHAVGLLDSAGSLQKMSIS